MPSPPQWTDTQKQQFAEWWDAGFPPEQISRMLMLHHGRSVSPHAVRNRARRIGLDGRFSGWSDKEKAAMAKLWASPLTVREIAETMTKRFGRQFTVGMVAGQSHRLKLPNRRK